MIKGFRCIGGPLDGQMKACEPGRTSFRVSRGPLAAVTPYGGRPVEVKVTDYEYQLQNSLPDGGFVWVCK